MDKGVNLGNWLVLEKWMSPELFAGTTAEDETNLCLQLSDEAKRERFKVHRDTFVTERDFLYLARRGLDHVRLPVPFFVFGDYEPFIGCIDYVDRAFDWAERHGMKVLLDLHTAPDSQNGFDNGGLCGVCKFHLNPKHVEFVLGVLEQLAARYRGREGLWGIEVLNEPISAELWEAIDIPTRYPPADPAYAEGSEPVPTDFLKQFYRDAYARIRGQSDDIRVVFHDGFRIREWTGLFDEPDYTNVVVDTHPYLMTLTFAAGDQDLDTYLAYVDSEFASTVNEMSRHFPLMIGEWCLDTASEKAAALVGAERAKYYRRIAAAQLAAWEKAVAWSYWSYKLNVDTPRLEPWDMGRVIERGYLPVDPSPSDGSG